MIVVSTVPELLSVNGGIYAKRIVVDNLLALNYDIYNAGESKSSKISISTEELAEGTRRNLLIDDEVLNIHWDDITNKPNVDFTAGTGISINEENEISCTVVNSDTTHSAGTRMSLSGTTFNCDVVNSKRRDTLNKRRDTLNKKEGHS